MVASLTLIARIEIFPYAPNMEAPEWIQRIAAVMRAIPAPNDSWAEIIGHLAWPVTIAWVILRFRHSIRRLIEILIIRFKSDDLGIANVLTVTRNSTLVPLDSGSDGDTDAYITERLLEYLSEHSNFATVQQWLNQQGRQALDIVEFITESEYADLRARAYRALVGGGGSG